MTDETKNEMREPRPPTFVAAPERSALAKAEEVIRGAEERIEKAHARAAEQVKALADEVGLQALVEKAGGVRVETPEEAEARRAKWADERRRHAGEQETTSVVRATLDALMGSRTCATLSRGAVMQAIDEAYRAGCAALDAAVEPPGSREQRRVIRETRDFLRDQRANEERAAAMREHQHRLWLEAQEAARETDARNEQRALAASERDEQRLALYTKDIEQRQVVLEETRLQTAMLERQAVAAERAAEALADLAILVQQAMPVAR